MSPYLSDIISYSGRESHLYAVKIKEIQKTMLEQKKMKLDSSVGPVTKTVDLCNYKDRLF